MKKSNVVLRLFSILLVCLFIFPDIASAVVVKKGDDITVYKSAVDDGQTETIKWRQGKMREAEYVVVDASLGNNDVPLFIQSAKKGEFLDRCNTSSDNDKICKVKVDNRFQYGIDKNKENSFLVFHNKTNKPYQHRFFTESTIRRLISAAKSGSKGIGYLPAKAFDKFLGGTKSFLGDYLRDF